MLFQNFNWYEPGVTVLVGGPLGTEACHLVDAATAGHLLTVGVRS